MSAERILILVILGAIAIVCVIVAANACDSEIDRDDAAVVRAVA